MRRLGASTGTLLVVANMVGTGVFATTGLLVEDLNHAGTVLLAWLFGGVVALCGALTYGELAAAIGRNGGEYRLLTDIFHPSIGFASGWISLVVGFSAPIAASALAFGIYASAVWPAVPPKLAGSGLIALVSIAHGARVGLGAGLQNVFTAAKILLILGFIAAAAAAIPSARWPTLFQVPGGGSDLLSPAFAIGLIYVAFAYSGWNGAAYLAGEIRNPGRNTPVALGLGTAFVVLMYVALNAVFLLGAPLTSLAGQVEVGHVVAVQLFGADAGELFSGLIALALISSVSAMVMTGPRVYEAMGADYERLRFLRSRLKTSGPIASTALQAALAIAMLMTSSFEALLMYIGFTLSISTGLTTAGIFVHRRKFPRAPRPYRAFGYPFTPLLFVAFAGWMVYHSVTQRPLESLWGAATIVAGLLFYRLARGKKPKAAP